MPREHDEISKRPARVIILDADDPMTEIHGQFVWQEEHDRVVAAVQRHAYAEGYAAGAQSANESPTQWTWKRRRPARFYVRLALLCFAIAVLLLLLLPTVLL